MSFTPTKPKNPRYDESNGSLPFLGQPQVFGQDPFYGHPQGVFVGQPQGVFVGQPQGVFVDYGQQPSPTPSSFRGCSHVFNIESGQQLPLRCTPNGDAYVDICGNLYPIQLDTRNNSTFYVNPCNGSKEFVRPLKPTSSSSSSSSSYSPFTFGGGGGVGGGGGGSSGGIQDRMPHVRN